MNSVLRSLYITTCLATISFLLVHGQSTCCPTENCCGANNCPALDSYGLTLNELVSMQPLYISFFPGIPMFAGVDSECFTYSLLPDGTYLLTATKVYSNGFNSTEVFILSQNDDGVFMAGKSTCITHYTVFDHLEKDDCSIYLMYVCFDYGNCATIFRNDHPVFGFSSRNTPISQDCLDFANDRISRAGLPNQDYFVAPFELDTICVSNC